MTTPAWAAQENGPPGQLNAVNSANGLNQFLGTHGMMQIGYGNKVVDNKTADQSYFVHYNNLATMDFAQSFTMSGTSIGRITVPFQVFGNGADLFLTLCPDNGSGAPNTAAPVCQVKVPASVLVATAASTGLENANGTFQLPWNNTQWPTNFSPQVNWISPASTVNGAPSFFAIATSGNYSILAGGRDQIGATPVAGVYTVQYTGGGQVSAPLPQPPLPQATQNGMLAVTGDTLVFSGGFTTGTLPVANVWSASWDPSTGVIGAWSAQTALPAGIQNGAGASYGEHIYVVSGQTGTTNATAVATVYMNTVSNSQLGSWVAMPPLPQAMTVPYVGVVGNWLIVAGGQNTAGTLLATCYYAAINPADGSLGPWQTGPTLAQAVCTLTPNWCTGVTTGSLIVDSGLAPGSTNGTYVQVLAATADGVAPQWNIQASNSPGVRASSAFTDGAGDWYVMGYNTNNTAQQNLVRPLPLISAPLYATGLTSGATYWVVCQMVQSSSASDYVGIALSENGTYANAQTSPRHQNTWSVYFAGAAIPLVVYDTTLSQPIIHVVEDSGTQTPTYQRWSLLARNQLGLLTGAVEVTMEPDLALNQNPTFTSGTSPWTATNGTLTQSSAQTHGGYAFSGLLTPTGGLSQAYASTELIPVRQTTYGAAQWYYVNGWFYTPTTWATFSLNVSWYDSGENFISTSNVSGNPTLTGATWTNVTGFATPPATAAYATVQPTMNNTPGSGNTLFISNCYIVLAPECVPALASIAEVEYPATGAPWPPLGVTQLN